MPLLNKKPLEKAPIPDNIRDDEKVFYCAATNEIFRVYEQFSERMFLCNSMVWTCALTGKNNLTYTEALESEENARNSLKEFPAELKTPILYLATKTKRTAFGDLAEDVFIFTKDRYFIGENIETSFTGSKWKDSHVLQVLAPEKKSPQKNGSVNNMRGCLPPTSYKYEIEHLDAEDEDISEIMIVDCNQMRRKKGSFSREKCKLFLKQYVELDEKGVFVIKPSIVESFNLAKINFDQIFVGSPPEFEVSKKKVRQESLHKFLTKDVDMTKSTNNAMLLEKMKKKEEDRQLRRQEKKERELEMKQKKKEENIVLQGLMKKWFKPQEDLELTDQQVLPKPTPVKSKIAEEHLGDVFMVMEFVHSFSKLLLAKHFFPYGLSLEIMERALTENEVAGPLVDLIQMFLNALFLVQSEESSQYQIDTENPNSIKEEFGVTKNLKEATRLATIASSWSKKYQGQSLGHLPLYSLTASEVLRLHLLSSGAIIKYVGARWRYQERGGYVSEDDPGLHLRLENPHILKALKTHSVIELSISDKLKIISCLMNQLLTYADVRDVVEEQVEKRKQTEDDYKLAVLTEKKREKEFLTTRFKLKKVKDDPTIPVQLEKLQVEEEKKKALNERKIETLMKDLCVYQIRMGEDRAFRQYLKLKSVPGFFVNCEAQNVGTCLNNIVEQNPNLVNAARDDVLTHIKGTMQDSNSSDKENSPSKSPKKVNGVLNGARDQKVNLCKELMMCSADITTCSVHSSNQNRWSFYPDHEQVTQLIGALNKRGIRENDLQTNLKNNIEEIEKIVANTPISQLNPDIECEEEEEGTKKVPKSRLKQVDPNLGYPVDMNPTEVFHNILIENILEMEEKLFEQGVKVVNDREKWRKCLQNKNYSELDKTLNRDDTDTEVHSEKEYHDPGEFVNTDSDPIPDIDNNDVLTQNEEVLEAIQSLSVALAQVARSVKKKCLKKPLGRMCARAEKKENILHLWEQSLLACTSFSQIFLHYSTLEACIIWKKRVYTKCRGCRKTNDQDKMLQCFCNAVYHIYCLKPKLDSVQVENWLCDNCASKQQKEAGVVTPKKKRPIFRDEEIEEEESMDSNGVEHDEEVDEEQEEEMVNGKVELCKTCGSGGEVITCEKCTNHYHIECVEPPLRRAPRGPWLCSSCKKINDRKRQHDTSEDEVISKRCSRRDDGRSDLPLHNSALHAVLSEVMKDSNAWPFVRPVQKTEVPDYYDVITKPMDFGTIKYKLNMGEYHEDAQFMSDALLVFQNCNTYNHTDDDVYKCGVELLKHFQRKCREVGLKMPDELDYDSRPKKRIRTN